MSRALSLGGGERKAAEEERSPMLVFARLRPMSEEEKETGSRSSVEIVNDTDVYLTSDTEPDHHRLKQIPGRHFRLDSTFPDTATQEQVYAGSTAHLVDGILQGRNGTVFCHGATGTGKTYTMLGTLENPGLMMLAIMDLFSKMGQSGHHGNHSIQLSYLEVNNEVVKDLMSPGRRLLLRQDGQGTVAVGLTHCIAHSAEEAMKLIQQGNRNSTTEPTRVNERSHAILQVIVEHKSMYEGSTITRVGKLSLFDLAGAESALVALKTCIDGPMGGKKSRPCRSTKLAQLLKDSIEGSHNIVMIASISPSNVSFGETQNTLHWTDRAKMIKTKAYSAANEEDVNLVLELQDKDSGLQIEVPDFENETDVAKLSLEMENIVLAAENVELRWKVKVLEAEVEKMKDYHLMHLKKADVAEANLWKERVAVQHTCTHILALPDDAIAEILLHLPQDSPSCLLRASLICKLWLRIVSDLGFLRRLRALHPTPPHVLGFFKHHYMKPEFVPTTASGFSLPGAMLRGQNQSILDCHHSRVLFCDSGPPMVLLVWEPVTNERRYVPMPEAFLPSDYFPPSGAVVCAADDCDHRGCHCHGGHFFLVLASAIDHEMFMDSGVAVWVYSSEKRAWGEPYLVRQTSYCPSRRPNTLVGRTIYLTLLVDLVLKYDLVKHNLAVLKIPGDLGGLCDFNMIIIPTEDGRMGFASVKDSSLSLWSCDDQECWVPHRVIGLDVPATYDIAIVGFAEGMDVIFLNINYVYFTIALKSERLRRLCEVDYSEMILPLVST